MPTTLIFGGHGQVAQHLTRLLAPTQAVHSIIRNPDQCADIRALGAMPVVQDIETATVAELAAIIRRARPDSVVWAAGAGVGSPGRTIAVDRDGAIKAMDACAAAASPPESADEDGGKGVKKPRYITVSALDVRDRENRPVPDWYTDADRALSDRVWGAIEPYLRAKLAADKSLRTENGRRGLDYTIVRPGGLTNEPGKGTVAAGKVSLGVMVSREDVARTVVAVMGEPGANGLAFDVVGGEVPVQDAVATVAKDKVDTFEGYY